MIFAGKTGQRVAIASAVLYFAFGNAVSVRAEDNVSLPRLTTIAAEGTVEQRSNPPLVTPPEPQRWAIGLGALYTHRKDETAAWLPNVEVNYSPSDRLQLHFMAPFVYDHLKGLDSKYGVGDIELGVRYRFVDDDPRGWRPAIAAYPLVDLPTGSQHDNLGTGRTHVFLPLWLSKTFGSWIPYGGGGYWINPGPGNRDWTFAALGLIRVLSPEWFLTGTVFYASSSKVGIKEQTGFSVGARYNVNDHHHMLFTIGRGLQNAQVTNEFTSYAQYVVTF